MEDVWGQWGSKPPCEHLLALRHYLEQTGLILYGEFTTDPNGWVNVHCPHCGRTYEVTLSPPWEIPEG